MAKVEGMHSRGSRWNVRILVPKDLQASLGRSRLDLSLGTSDRREATLQAMKLRKGKPIDFFGRWFKEHRESLGLAPSFHYFRHAVRPLMRQAGIPDETQDKVTGHASKGSVGTVVYGCVPPASPVQTQPRH